MAKVLICEDDRVARELLEEIMRAEGLAVDAVATGDAAIERAIPDEYDLVISDVQLGDGATGMDVLDAFRKKAAGFINGTGSVGAIFQGFVTAYVAQRWGWNAMFAVFGLLSLLAATAVVPYAIAARRGR